MNGYDVIVLGTGGVGSAAACHLARRGARVLGLDRFPGGHQHGSSHGQTRIIRKAYFEHPDYVPLLQRAYELWGELEQQSGESLYFPVGLVEIGPAEGIVIPGVLASARQHDLPVETLDAAALNDRYPGYRLPDGYLAVFERQAGYLLVEDCVIAHLDQAARHGADLRSGQSVVDWRCNGSGVVVRTESADFAADHLVIAAGPWAGRMLGDLDVKLEVRRKHLHWYLNDDPRYRADAGCPAFFYETSEGYFYGFPQIDALGVKLAEHSGGTVIDDPLEDDQRVEPRDRARIEHFLREHLPGVSLQPSRHAVCYYTCTADEHFVVDRHPNHERVTLAAGLSGHGFKLASVLGEALADLALDGETSLPIGFLSVHRESLCRARR